MAIHWQIPFKSLRSGILYTVNIYDATYNSTPIILKGGAQPFVTEEDNTDDMFTPMRTQTGYIRIIDDDKDADGNAFNWKDVLPSTDIDRPVTLTHVASGQTIVDWQGYMQAQTFAGTLYGNPQEREFPIQCPLSALSASNVSGAERNIHNFAYLIREAFATLTGITINNYIFQGGLYARNNWLLARVDWQNLINVTDNGVTGAYNNRRIIEDICYLFGWTVRVHKQNVIFACADDTSQTGALVLTQANLDYMAENEMSAGDASTNFLTDLSLSGDIFASVNNDDFLTRGYNKAVVSVECNTADDEIMSIYPDSVRNQMIDDGYYDGGNDTWYTNDLRTFFSTFLDGNAVTNKASFNLMRHADSYNSFSVHNVIRIYDSYNNGSTYATLLTKFQHTYPGGSLAGFRGKGFMLHGSAYRNGERYEDYESNYGTGQKTMYMRLYIVASSSEKYYWTGSSWSSTVSSFRATLGGRDDNMFSVNDHGGKIDVIPLEHGSTALHGTVYVEFLGSDDMPESNGQRIFDIADFSIEYVASSIFDNIAGEQTYKSSTEYVATNLGKACDEWNADLIYASQNGLARGYGLLIGSDWQFMEGVQYAASIFDHPEQHLASRVASYWANAKRRLYVELLSNAGVSAGIAVRDISPRNKVMIDGTQCYPIAISRDWRDDVSRLTFMEL